MLNKKSQNNYAFIDGNNLHLSVINLGWKLDHRKFRVYLRDKFSVTNAYYFIGYIPQNGGLYSSLESAGYTLIFKPTYKGRDGDLKGNCDAELVLQAMIDFHDYEKAVIVTSDGGYYSGESFKG